MTREIKFRAWDGEKMITDFAVIGGSCFIETNSKNNDYVDVFTCGTVQTYFSDWATYKNFDYPIMQFIGLLDKKGVEIYEGDIVRFSDSTYSGIYDVRFNEGSWQLYTENEGGNPNTEDLYLWKQYCEVIGNIYDKP